MSKSTQTQDATGDPLSLVQKSLYEKRQKIYPRETNGIFSSVRRAIACLIIAGFIGLPWLQWQGQQAFLIDLPGRKFTILWWTFWPQDFIYAAVLAILAVLALFFFTALAGRLWCGYSCPQTVWTEAFIWVERLIEGSRTQQIKLDKSANNLNKVAKKISKHLVWLAIAVLTGFAFAGYFTPVRDLTFQLVGGDLSFWQGFWLLFYSAATYGNAGWMREQVCLYMCPYARLQSAMLDRNSLVISYDPKRGEPRGGRSRQQDPKSLALGECIDCTLCAQVCPTGIDIRDGLQYQCIGCAACIDVCNQVMDKMNYPRGLIRYTTENALMGLPSQILRPRMMIYGFLLSALSVGLLAAVVLRVPLELDIIRDRNLLYVETVQGEIENVYTLKIINMDKEQHEYLLTIEGSDGIRVAQTDNIIVKAGEILEYPVRVSIPKKAISSRNQALHFRLQALDRPRLRVTEVGRFLAPNG